MGNQNSNAWFSLSIENALVERMKIQKDVAEDMSEEFIKSPQSWMGNKNYKNYRDILRNEYRSLYDDMVDYTYKMEAEMKRVKKRIESEEKVRAFFAGKSKSFVVGLMDVIRHVIVYKNPISFMLGQVMWVINEAGRIIRKNVKGLWNLVLVTRGREDCRDYRKDLSFSDYMTDCFKKAVKKMDEERSVPDWMAEHHDRCMRSLDANNADMEEMILVMMGELSKDGMGAE